MEGRRGYVRGGASFGRRDFKFPGIHKKRNPAHIGELLLQKNPDAVIVSEEVGYGVVPVDAFEREYREAVGRICTKLAAGSRRVTRVICGIGTVIKK